MPDAEVVLVGHGGAGNQRVVSDVAAELGLDAVFVDGEPSLEEFLELGEGEVVAVPLLLADGYTLRCVREELEASGRPYRLAEALGSHPGVVEAARDRMKEVLEEVLD